MNVFFKNADMEQLIQQDLPVTPPTIRAVECSLDISFQMCYTIDESWVMEGVVSSVWVSSDFSD